jgi:hypothetical protein
MSHFFSPNGFTIIGSECTDLKGVWHEIFDFRFFYHEIFSLGPLSIPFGPFQIFTKIRRMFESIGVITQFPTHAESALKNLQRMLSMRKKNVAACSACA